MVEESRNRWTETEDAVLIALRDTSMSWAGIALRMGKGKGSIVSRAFRLGLTGAARVNEDGGAVKARIGQGPHPMRAGGESWRLINQGLQTLKDAEYTP